MKTMQLKNREAGHTVWVTEFTFYMQLCFATQMSRRSENHSRAHAPLNKLHDLKHLVYAVQVGTC